MNNKKSHIFITLVFFSFFIVCATTKFTGDWTYEGMDIRNESAVRVTISALENIEYYIEAPKLDFSGVYEDQMGILVMIKPNNPRMTGFKMKVEKEKITIIAQPETRITKKKYIGGIFTRH